MWGWVVGGVCVFLPPPPPPPPPSPAEYFYMRNVGVSLEVVGRQMRDIGLDERVLALDEATQVPADCDDVMSYVRSAGTCGAKLAAGPTLTPHLVAALHEEHEGDEPEGEALAEQLAAAIKESALAGEWDRVDGLLTRASEITVTVEMLSATGIGRVVGALVRAPDEGTQLLAREIVRNWKRQVHS